MTNWTSRVFVSAVVAAFVLVGEPCWAGFALNVSATGGFTQTVRDNEAGDLNSADGRIYTETEIVVGGTTVVINMTIGTSKPNAPNNFYTRGMTLTEISVQQTGAVLEKDLNITISLTDTGFAAMSPLAPTSVLRNTFTFNNLSAPTASGDFQSFAGLSNQEFEQLSSVSTTLLAANSYSGQTTSTTILSPTDLFSITQVAHIKFVAGSSDGAVSLTGQTLVFVPEPSTWAIWGGLSVLGVACSWLRRWKSS